MARISTSTSVADLVVDRPSRAQIFEELGLDYCCRGKRLLGEACESRGLDAGLVVTLLRVEAAGDEQPEVDWSTASIAQLCDHIVEAHHGYLRRELPRLARLWRRVERLHGAGAPAVREVRLTFDLLREELERHTVDEEQTVFPCLRELADGGRADDVLAAALATLEHEHATTGDLLTRLEDLTDGYDSASALSTTHRQAIDGLRELELDLHDHIHEENNLLFPRVLGQILGQRATPV